MINSSKRKLSSPNLTSLYTNKKVKIEKLDHPRELKISTWNVGGLRACIDKGTCLKYILSETPDIMALQQIRCQEDEVPKSFLQQLGHYHMYWIGSDKGQGGIGLLTKVKPLSVEYGLPGFRTREGRIITAEFSNFTFLNVYAPNSGIKLKTIDYRMAWDKHFYKYIQYLLNKGAKLVISGDLNICLKSIDLARPEQNQRTAGYTIEERTNFQNLLDLGLIDTFRYFYPKQEGAYTYWSFRNKLAKANNKGWRLDYHLVSEKLIGKVHDCEIRSDIYVTTHCPVVLYLST